MKKKFFGILLLLALVFTMSVQASATTKYTVTGTKNYLALRNKPVTSKSNEIGKLYNGDAFYVTGMNSNGFAYGYTADKKYGYVNSKFLTKDTTGKANPPVPPSKKYTDGIEYLHDSVGDFDYEYDGRTGYELYITSYSPVIDRGKYYEIRNCSIDIDEDGGSEFDWTIPVAENTTIYVRKNCTDLEGRTAEQIMKKHGKLFEETYDGAPTIHTCMGRFDSAGYLVEASWDGFS